MLSVGPDQIKLLQPGPEVTSNLNDPYIQGLSKLPQPGPESHNSLNDPFISCIAGGSPKVDSSPNDLYTICIPKTMTEPSLGP